MPGEMAGLVDLARLGGDPSQDDHRRPRAGNPPPRTVETTGGMLNSIGLDNDGIEAFIARQLPYLAGLGPAIIVSIAGKSYEEFVEMAARLDGLPGVAALELNISCPNVSGGVDFGTDPAHVPARSWPASARACSLPILAKLTPNVTDLAAIARAAEAGGADAISLDQHLPGHGRRLAPAPAAVGQRDGRAERAGDQADRPAGRVPGRPGRGACRSWASAASPRSTT